MGGLGLLGPGLFALEGLLDGRGALLRKSGGLNDGKVPGSDGGDDDKVKPWYLAVDRGCDAGNGGDNGGSGGDEGESASSNVSGR